MSGFSRFAANAEKRVRDTVERRIRAYAVSLIQSLQTATPYATGQAQASWLATVGMAGTAFYGPSGLSSAPADLAHKPPTRVDVAGSQALSLAVIEGWRLGQPLTIYNAVPYIVRLNAGYSRQAPGGFVEAALMRASAASRGQ